MSRRETVPGPEGADRPAGPDDATPRARVHIAEWSPWVWVLPALAILVVGWLVVRYGWFGGGDVTVRFADARGLERYNPVRYRGAKVGTVRDISLDDELGEVVVRISLDGSMSGAMRSGTRFWIVEPGVESGGLGGLLAGTYVGIAPGEGEETREFVGQEYPPVLAAPGPGKRLVLDADERGSIAIGSSVEYQGVRVGRVLGTEHDAASGGTRIHVFVVERFADQVREATRFWRTGGLQVSLDGGGLSLGDSSLSALLGGGVAFYTPEIFPGDPVAEGSSFELHDSRSQAVATAGGPHLTYRTYFPGSVAGLAAGTPVRLRGLEIGHVREVRLRYDEATASLETPVTLELDPRRLELDQPPPESRVELRARMDRALQALVRGGLRATLASSLVLPGASAVLLESVAPPGTGELLLAEDPPVIPAAAAGGGIGDAVAAIQEVAARVRELPLREIAGDLRSTTSRLDSLAHDPRLDRSLDRLDLAMADLAAAAAEVESNAAPITGSLRNAASSAESAAATADANIERIAASLRNAADSAESAAATLDSAATTVGDNVEPIAATLRSAADSVAAAAGGVEDLVGSSTHQGFGVGELVEELTRAAEAVRALAAYLTENPDALLKGRE